MTDEQWPSPLRAWYSVAIFALALTMNFLDRGIVGLLVEPIKRDLALSDFQISLIIGFAFSCMYLVLGLPIARLVDVASRRLIIGVGIATWSAATALCGLAQNFLQLFVARVGVGIGEACNGPATFSMMADLFPPRRLPRAIAVLNFGFVAGLGLSLLMGGVVIHYLGTLPPVELPVVGELRDWQMTFVAVGVPGLVVAVLLATVPEPKRRGLLSAGVGANVQGKPKSIPLAEVGRFLLDNRRAYAPMFLGVAVNTVLAFGHQAWYAAFFSRTYGWSASQFALVFGSIILVGAPVMLIVGSRLAEWYAKKGYHDANMRVTLIAAILVMPGAIGFAFMPTPELAVAVISFNFCVAMLSPGPQNAALQIITPNQMRGQVTALFLFVFNIIGFGLGATVVATITDYVIGDELQLRYSLALTSAILGPLAILIFWWGLKPYAHAVERAEMRYAAEGVPAGG